MESLFRLITLSMPGVTTLIVDFIVASRMFNPESNAAFSGSIPKGSRSKEVDIQTQGSLLGVMAQCLTNHQK